MDQFTGNNLGHSDFVLCLELIQQSRFIHSFDYFDISRFDCAFAVMHLQNLRHGRPQTHENLISSSSPTTSGTAATSIFAQSSFLHTMAIAVDGGSPVRRGASPVRSGGDDDDSRSPSPSIPLRKSRDRMQTPSATAKYDSPPRGRSPQDYDSIRFMCCFTWRFA